MKKAILLPLALLLVGGLVYAADLSGKVEAKAALPSDGGDFTEEYAVEANINASVDDYNTATIELRGSAGSSVDYGSLFLESDLGGALGLTEASGVGLKIKAGDFKPETSDKGRISDNYIGTSDVVNGDLGANGVGTNVVISYTDLVQLTVGLNLGADENFDYFFDVSGSAAAGPGTLGYTVFYSEGDNAGFYADQEARDDDELSSRTSIGVEVQYANIAVADNFTIGVGAELELLMGPEDGSLVVGDEDGDETVEDGEFIAYSEDGEAGMLIGANLVANFDSWLGLEVGFKTVDVEASSNNDFDTRLGVGLGLSTPDGIMGVKLPFELDMSANMAEADVDDDNPYNFDNTSFKPKLWLKAGAAEFSIEYALDLVDDSVRSDDAEDVDNSSITLQASLGF